MELTARVGMRIIAAAAYVARPWSCGVVLTNIPREDSPYEMFDYHGVGFSVALATTILLSPAAFILIRNGTENALSFRDVNTGSVGVALVVLLFLGTPLLTQYSYLTGLPLSLSWPVALSSAVWFVIAAYLCAAALTGRERVG